MRDFLRDLWLYMRERKKIWLLPCLLAVLLLSILAIAGQSAAVAPFVYTLF